MKDSQIYKFFRRPIVKGITYIVASVLLLLLLIILGPRKRPTGPYEGTQLELMGKAFLMVFSVLIIFSIIFFANYYFDKFLKTKWPQLSSRMNAIISLILMAGMIFGFYVLLSNLTANSSVINYVIIFVSMACASTNLEKFVDRKSVWYKLIYFLIIILGVAALSHVPKNAAHLSSNLSNS